MSSKNALNVDMFVWTWNSQPFIKDIPAGNILLSASILLSGSSPAKALRMLKHVNMISIKERAFYDHQKKFLEPATISVWKEQQVTLLANCTSKGPITIGGGGRADT